MDTQTNPVDLKLTISYRQIINMALPISLSIFIPQFNYLTNNFFLGNYDKNGELLALGGITGVYYLAFAVTGYGLNNGLQALISRRAGEDRIEEISKLFWNGIRCALFIAFIGITLSYTIGSNLLLHSLKSDVLATKAVSFLKIRIWGLPMLLIFQLCNVLLISSNNSRFLLYATIIETIANIFFDYVLIYGKWGFPEMGFNGAAYASLITEGVAMVASAVVLYGAGIIKKLGLDKNTAFNAEILKLIAIQSLPLIFQLVISIVSWEFFYILVERHGQILRGDTLESAISNVMRNFFGFFGCTTWALASTCNTMVSNVIGQNLQDRVLQVVRMIMTLSGGLALVFALLINLFPETILSIYGQSAVFITEGVPVARVVSLAIVMMSLGAIALNGVNGTAQTRVTLNIEIVAIIIYSVYVYLIYEVWKMPFIVGWCCEFIYWSSILGMAYFYLKSGRWKGKTI
ncbi:MAG: MATE family efflux transporter [Saprospiraceae bacterium]|nr:MATE family efflux transporter [Saprospiraceae bacterium]